MAFRRLSKWNIQIRTVQCILELSKWESAQFNKGTVVHIFQRLIYSALIYSSVSGGLLLNIQNSTQYKWVEPEFHKHDHHQIVLTIIHILHGKPQCTSTKQLLIDMHCAIPSWCLWHGLCHLTHAELNAMGRQSMNRKHDLCLVMFIPWSLSSDTRRTQCNGETSNE